MGSEGKKRDEKKEIQLRFIRTNKSSWFYRSSNIWGNKIHNNFSFRIQGCICFWNLFYVLVKLHFFQMKWKWGVFSTLVGSNGSVWQFLLCLYLLPSNKSLLTLVLSSAENTGKKGLEVPLLYMVKKGWNPTNSKGMRSLNSCMELLSRTSRPEV